jgi:hypothetical protein
MREVFLKSNDSCFSNNVESNLNVNLSTKVRLLPNENLSELFSLNDQYNKERDECNKFRLILGINPICSNVLYNAKTEVVIDEGSSNVNVIVDDNKISSDNSIIKRSEYMDAIRNTEKSHPELGNYTYHCGYNIFNNHMLRNDGFVHVNKEKQLSNNGTYNTIADYLRNSQGEVIKQDIGVKYTSSPEGTNMHLYRFDSVISMRTAFLERCEEIDGWWGFINSSNINIPNRNDETILTNRIINNKKACEFIDLYPDRSLYSFIPKYNKYRKRLEKNWDYCITYPYENDYTLIDTVCGGRNGAIRANFHKRYNSNGIEVLQCESYFKHNLKINDYINIYYTDNQGEGVKRVRVETIGDGLGENKDKVFTIKLSDVISILPDENSHFFFKRLSGGDECQYYFRKFKKLKNIDDSDLKSDINKIAFGKNIYGDDTAQIIFTDDINIEGLVDNNGRPVSKVYFTVVKRNAGYENWYIENNFNDEKIEYSHCFGKVTSGLDFSGIKDEPWNYNVHRLHNLDTAIEEPIGKTTLDVWGDAVSSEVLSIEDNITIGWDDFYGDVVEYDIANAKETIISPIYHRVNTAQREVFNEKYRDILQDKIVSDDYDYVNGTNSQFKIETYYLNDVVNSTTEWSSSSVASVAQVGEGEKKLIYGNIMPEGNYYNPHFQIDLKYEDDVVSEAPAKLLNTNKISINGDNVVVIEDIPTNYGFYKGDFIAFLYENITKWGEIIKIEENGFKLHVQLDENIEIKNYKAYWSPNNVPIYAKLLPNKRKFTWRKLLNQSELKNTNPLYDMTFSNGRLYIEKNINFFLRRQDPFGKYGLSTPIFNDNNKVYSNPMDDYNIPGSKQTDFSGVIYSINNFDNCY